MVERVAPHKHCPECGVAIGIKEDYCSEGCKEAHSERLKAKRRQLLWLYFGSVAILAVVMLLWLGSL